jgi:nitrate/TMAO reductase-like tetraheme cytochrome c subunit
MDKKLKQAKQRFPDHFYNSITYSGVMLSVFIIACELFLFAIDFTTPKPSVYLGIITYMLLPPFLILGLILIPIGAYFKRQRILHGSGERKPKPIIIDLSLSTHQNMVVIFMVGTMVLLIMTAIGSYKAYNYTESTQFCGVTCHQVMKPEYTTHNGSPHERVKCVECHVGSGANWYLHYKVAGTRMVVKSLDGSYARPVPAPVETLRPAKETCEECHWPGKAFSAIQLNKVYFADDPTKTAPWKINLLMHIGGGSGSAGIHAHMYFGNDIYYVPEDAKRQKITWIETINKVGKVTIYMTDDSPYKKIDPPAQKIRRMDCIDCHNRATHRFEAPDVLMNQALARGDISPSIPMIKSKGVEVLGAQYGSSSEAAQKIRSSIIEFYTKKQPEYYAAHQADVEKAAGNIILLYQQNFFPEMKSRWDVYPDNIGHMISQGCFRCHDEQHKTKTGEVISRDCKLCHTITEQGRGAAVQKSTDGLDFQHPWDGDESWKTTNCTDCHTGG